MELTDIMALVKAGFTRDDIRQMEQKEPNNPNPEPVQLAMDIPAQTNEPVPAQVAEPVAVPGTQPAQPSMAQLMESIAKLTSAVQSNAIAHSVIPGGMHDAPTAEDMLAEIIRPTYKERV